MEEIPASVIDALYQFVAKMTLSAPQTVRASRAEYLMPWRFAMMQLLSQTGVSLSAVGRALGRDHSTVCHGLERFAAMADGQAYLRALETHVRTAPPGHPLRALSGTAPLAAYLETAIGPRDAAAVVSYAEGTLLSRRRPALLDAYGLSVVRAVPAARERLERWLADSGLSSYIPAIDTHIARPGRRCA